MVKTKHYYAELVLRKLQGFEIGRDLNVDERDVFSRLDQLVNSYARLNHFENIKNFGQHEAGELFITTFENLDINDGDDNTYGMDYLDLPARYAQLPKNKGINYVAPMNDIGRPFIPLTMAEYASTKRSIGRSLQGRTGYIAKGQRLLFTNSDADYEKVYLRLVISDASEIASDAEYPIPPDYEMTIIDEAVAYFINKPLEDNVNDTVDQG